MRNLVDTSLQRSERNAWAKHWFRRFLAPPNDIEAWAAFRLFLRCVDQRFWLWYEAMVNEKEAVPSARRSFIDDNVDRIKQRARKNQRKIEKQFLGHEVKHRELWPWMT